jgi:hypothetical protein
MGLRNVIYLHSFLDFLTAEVLIMRCSVSSDCDTDQYVLVVRDGEGL